MIEPVLLPELSSAPQTTLNFSRGKVLPRFALIEHALFVNEGGQQVNMVRHDDEIGELVSIPVEVAEAVGHDPGERRLAQYALTVARIEMTMPAIGKRAYEF